MRAADELFLLSLLIARCIAVADNQENNRRVTGLTNYHDQLHQTHLVSDTEVCGRESRTSLEHLECLPRL